MGSNKIDTIRHSLTTLNLLVYPSELTLDLVEIRLDAMTSAPCLLSKCSINFSGACGPYSHAQAITHFGNLTQGWNESRAHITTDQCQIKLCKNSLSASGGMIAKYKIPPGSEYTTTFKVKFHADFEWCTGGKLGLGFFIGDGAAGGSGCNGQGGSARLVWHKHPKTAEVYLQAYAYHEDQKSRYGECFGRYPAEGSLVKDQWYDVTLCVKSNTDCNADGRLRVNVDGFDICDRMMRWTTDDCKRLINRMEFATFRGGATDDYKSRADSYIYYSGLSWARRAL